jgi:hypothetical protein
MTDTLTILEHWKADQATMTPEEARELWAKVPGADRWTDNQDLADLFDRASYVTLPAIADPAERSPMPQGNGQAQRGGGVATVPPSDKQVAYLRSLVDGKDLSAYDGGPFPGIGLNLVADAQTDFDALLPRLTGGRGGSASRLIDVLVKLPWATKPKAKAADKPAPKSTDLDLRAVPSGRYADPEGGDSRLKVRIDNVDKGKWQGWVFVKDAAVYGQGKRYGAQRPEATTYSGDIADVLTRIAADPKAAAVAYGRLTGTCGRCGATLEDEQSVRNGIGPICADKF